MGTVPLHEIVRPAYNRDDAGRVGESLHALADWIQANKPDITMSNHQAGKQIKQLVFACKPPIKDHNH